VSSVLRTLRAGVAASLVAGLIGWTVERVRFGASDAAALERVQSELRDRLDATAGSLAAIAARVAVPPETLRNAERDTAVARTLFEQASAALRDQQPGRTGVSIYGGSGTPLAWAGRVFDLPKERLNGPPAWFVAPGAIGPRLVHVQPIGDRVQSGRGAPRGGAIVVEYSLATAQDSPGLPTAFVVATSLVPVTLRPRVNGAPAPNPPFAFIVSSRDGALAAEADVAPADLAAARAWWSAATWFAVVALLATTLLLCAAPLIELRRHARDRGAFVTYTLTLAAVCLGALALLLSALRGLAGGYIAASPPGLLLIAFTALALVALLLDLVERRRVARPRPNVPDQRLAGGRIAARHVAAGAAAAAVLAAYERVLQGIVANTSLDVLHFSLHPLEWARLAVAFALLLMHASAVWAAVAVTRAASTFFRTPRSAQARLTATAGWVIGVGVVVAALGAAWGLPVAPLSVAAGAAGVCAVALARVERKMRRASHAARLFAFFLALLIPALAVYPSLVAYAIDAKQRLVAQVYGPEVKSQREDLQRRLQQTIDQIDAVPSLSAFLAGSDTASAADRAFIIWSRTSLAAYRLTSAVELYGPDGSLVSRFALHLPEYEYAAAGSRASSCTWAELFDEVSPFGSSERHVLRTSRGICERGRILGTIVVRVMLDYRTLPFISTQSPYLESLQASRTPSEGISGRDVEFAMYGWTRAPIIESGTTVWTLPDPVFARLVASREPFWETLDRDGQAFQAYLLSDRGAIYALGYPVITWFGHLINLAELALLAMVLYAILLGAATVVGALTAGAPASGRALLREIRSSFYRKLFLAFVAGAVVPVVILAVAIRTYFANELTAGGVDSAQRTVTTAQRLVEDYAAIQQSGSTALSTLDDQIMVLVWRAIDEDVNVFDRGHLQATSARDLFASLLLSTRTPGDVYKSILIDRAPTFVGDEQIGDHPYRLAAAPVRAGGRDGIVTVPLTNRREQIEQQIDELDRRVRSAAVLFIFLGAAIGYWMAERIADPVNRLTRATRRIARGELDARIATTSSDELRRLVEDFNQMAADLQRQRAELERTQRLRAWADMARQVAHDIKNPLTPIQLSAEHARRVNIDRGRPLSPALDECVDAILGQVRLLRQISAEFSSFASSPTPRPEPTDVPALIDEVVGPYRLGLSGRIDIDTRAEVPQATAVIDRTLFARALTNVIENALHAMPGAGRLTITTRLDSANGAARRLVVEIADTGVGMDQDALNRIFEPYFSTKASGTGLGLTIAKRNVELNGGGIEVRSVRGVGTTVALAIPC
jgi:signal transduction histidine kinase